MRCALAVAIGPALHLENPFAQKGLFGLHARSRASASHRLYARSRAVRVCALALCAFARFSITFCFGVFKVLHEFGLEPGTLEIHAANPNH